MKQIKVIIITLLSMQCLAMFGQESIERLSWTHVATQMPDEWYGSPESIRVAENVLMYQRDIGGWPKNTPIHVVVPESKKPTIIDTKGLNDAIFDNDATTTEMKFLAKMYAKTGNLSYKESYNRGLEFILDAQYKNGGWPMFYPLRKGYFTHITFNDDAIANILYLLRDIKDGKELYAPITDPKNVTRSKKAYNKGLKVILKTQIIVDGKPTVWCAQHDERTLLPTTGRTYELPSFSGAESVGIVLLLMDIEEPSKEIIKAVDGAFAWFDSHRVKGIKVENFINDQSERDRRVVQDPSAPDLWARFYDLETAEPIFCDRDGIKKKSMAEIGLERRRGYSWYTNKPQQVIDAYPAWKAKHE